MTESATAQLFMHGCSQAVRLPGKEVKVRKVGRDVLLEPVEEPFDMAAWWAKLDQYKDIPFLPEGRGQPPTPVNDRQYLEDGEDGMANKPDLNSPNDAPVSGQKS
ncbi:antitoxin [Astrobacterium formosum]|uniref:antitoxin n=1 Tax=Astrobacterium formosum TaxID=3069710 RepID=UPI003F4F68DB